MKIERIEIRSYRSIAHLAFSLEELTAIVGPNDSGKSNIFRAIDLFFDYGKTTTATDINQSTRRHKTEVSVVFRNLSKEDIALLREWIPTQGADSISIRKVCEPGKDVGYFERSRNNQIGRKAIQRFLNGKFVLIPSLRDASLEFSHSNGALFRDFIFRRNQGLKAKRLQRIRSDWQSGLKRFRTHLNSSLQGIIQEATDSLGLKNLHVGTSDSIDRILHTITIQLSEQFGSKERDIPLLQHGHGIQSMLVMSLYEAINQSRLCLMILEEPENHLHPNQLHQLLNRVTLIAKKHQVLLSTHSPITASHIPIDSFRRVSKDEKGLTQASNTSTTKAKKNEKLLLSFIKVLNSVRSELFFANKVVLCEGASEFILPRISCRLESDYDILRENIVFVSCDGKSFGMYAQALDYFRIPWIILCDNDYWASGEWHKMASTIGLNKAGKRIFERIRPEKRAESLALQQLKKRFGTVCLPKRLEEAVLGTDTATHSSIAAILQTTHKSKYQYSVKTHDSPTKDELLDVMSKDKPLWAKVIGSSLSPSSVSNEIKEVLTAVKTTRPANFQ